MSPQTGARHLSEELAAIRSRVMDMASIAEELLHGAMGALREQSVPKAVEVIMRDREVDALELELDEACISVLALHQPVARDLRLIAMTMRIASDLERIGDHAVNIAEAVGHLQSKPRLGRFQELDEMARLAGKMLGDALDAFIRSDADLARDVCRRDDRVDSLLDALFRILLTHMMEEPRRIGPAMSLILVSRNLERVADLATNIAEDVVYMVEGRSIKHGGGYPAGPAIP
jgi:phosphate transport system protein